MTKSHAIKALLQQLILSGRISQWLLQDIPVVATVITIQIENGDT